MKIKLFVALEIQYFELRIFSFNSYVYSVTRGFIASARAFNLLTRAFNIPTRDFNLATRGFSLLTRGFELVTRGFEIATRGFELVTPNSCFTFPPVRIAFHSITTTSSHRRCSVKKVFLEISQNSQENSCAKVSFLTLAQVFSFEFCEIFENTFFYRTPMVAASILHPYSLLENYCSLLNRLYGHHIYIYIAEYFSFFRLDYFVSMLAFENSTRENTESCL